MSDSGNSSTRPRVGDENSMSGELLAELIRAHRQPNNAVHLSLEGAEYLAAGDASIGEDTPTDASQAPESAYTPLTGARAYTRTVNLEVAHARLQHMLADADDENAARVQRTYHEPALDDGLDERTALEERDVYLERENRSVLWLRNRGVPLLYNPELLLAVRADPRRFEGMLRAFYLHPPMENDAPEICFFERQALRWEEFNRFQLHCRGVSGAILDDERIFEAAYAALIVREADSAREWKQLMANPILGHKPSRKEAFRRKLEEDAVYLRDRGCSTFAQYQEATRARLARHGFEVPQGFAPLRDVTAAGRRERWLEYAAYECWHMEHYRRDVELYRDGHDEAYAALREAVPLQERETAEFLATEDAAIQLRVERDLARARCGQLRLDRALLRRRRSSSAGGGGGSRRPLGELTEAESETRQRAPRQQRRQRQQTAGEDETAAAAERALEACEAALAEAEEEAATAVRREEAVAVFLDRTSGFRDALEVLERQEYLLAWVRDKYVQMEMEEAEAAAAEEVEGGRDTLPSPRGSHVSFRLHEDSEDSVGGDAESDRAAAVAREKASNTAGDDVAAAAAQHQSPSPRVEASPSAEAGPESGPPAPAVTRPRSLAAAAVVTRPRSLAAAAVVTPAPPRRSARIAALREKAAAAAPAAAAAAVVSSVEGEGKKRAAVRGKKRGRSSSEAEEELRDAPKPAKRTRRRGAKK